MKCRVEINICHHFKKKTTDEDDQEDHDDGGGGGDLLDHLTAVWRASITTLILPVYKMVGQYNQCC